MDKRTNLGQLIKRPMAMAAAIVLLCFVAAALAASWLGTVDPTQIFPVKRLQVPSAENWFGTDMFGRDIYSRVLFGTRVSLTVGFSVAILASILGVFVGLVSGFFRTADSVIMRINDGLMSIPPVLLAIALTALVQGGLVSVIAAITIAEVPRMARLVRGVVLSLREQPYVDAAIASGLTTPQIMLKHIVPNTMAPVVVQATYVCASAMITEALLSFIGTGVPTTTPSWGNIMAEARTIWQVKPYILLFPGLALSLTVLSVNILGDALRDWLDPRSANRT